MQQWQGFAKVANLVKNQKKKAEKTRSTDLVIDKGRRLWYNAKNNRRDIMDDVCFCCGEVLGEENDCLYCGFEVGDGGREIAGRDGELLWGYHEVEFRHE